MSAELQKFVGVGWRPPVPPLTSQTRRSLRATGPRAAPVRGLGVPARTIAISATCGGEVVRFELSAGDAAELMFEIGYALEQAAAKAEAQSERV
jgi:hypothetical protein